MAVWGLGASVPSLDEAKARKVTGRKTFFCDRPDAAFRTVATQGRESGNAYTRCCFQRPRLNNTSAHMASTENDTGMEMNTPVGPKPK